jgi:hypothetical protein
MPFGKISFFFLQNKTEKNKMWRGALLGLLLALLKIAFDVVRGVGTPTKHLQEDQHLWKLLRAQRQPPEVVMQLDNLVGAFLHGGAIDAQNVRSALEKSPEPIRVASEELIAKI